MTNPPPTTADFDYIAAQRLVMGEAVSLTNRAIQKSREGHFHDAELLYRQALALKIRAFGDESGEAAHSYNGLGEELFCQGKYAEAEEVLTKAVRIRDRLHNGRYDAACSRENLARIYEAHGRLQDARAMRKSDTDKEIACANYHCPLSESLKKDRLKQCAVCHCVFYCSKECQKADWKRHKPFCKEVDGV